MADAREFDIIVYGATGYTGRLVAEYLKDKSGLKWAMAGRSQAKLEQVRDLIAAPADTPLVVADASDHASLDSMCKRTKVVLTTVGPYQLYGDELVAACVANGTDYTDLCGEPAWMRQKIDQHDAAAKASGARISLGIAPENPLTPLQLYFPDRTRRLSSLSPDAFRQEQLWFDQRKSPFCKSKRHR